MLWHSNKMYGIIFDTTHTHQPIRLEQLAVVRTLILEQLAVVRTYQLDPTLTTHIIRSSENVYFIFKQSQ